MLGNKKREMMDVITFQEELRARGLIDICFDLEQTRLCDLQIELYNLRYKTEGHLDLEKARSDLLYLVNWMYEGQKENNE